MKKETALSRSVFAWFAYFAVPSTASFRRLFLAVVLIAAFAAGCQTPGHVSRGAQAEVTAALEQQVREWNAGNLAGFMETYARSDRIRFASGGDVSLGWQTVFDRYQKRYGDRAAMGALTFSDLDIALLGPDAALAFGRWRLKRERDEPSGLFTLVFRKTPDGWRIVHDHTSAAEKK
ncbi:MAG TPA: DUF4440 domain-containing protein [Verrucomicrobiae bacterium]|nr:DUF4440 domain-containing protein [Verrucomicrobiae bacterium]